MSVLRPLLAALFALALLAAPASSAPTPPKLPDPTYTQTVAKEVLVRMDDGIDIATTITWPSRDSSTPAPDSYLLVPKPGR